MFKIFTVVLALVACVAAKPGLLSAPFAAPLVAAAPAPFVTATSSQVYARNYNGIATAPIIAAPAPVAAIPAPARFAVAARYAAPFAAAYTAPAAVAAPYFARYAAAPAPYVAPYAAPFGYAPSYANAAYVL